MRLRLVWLVGGVCAGLFAACSLNPQPYPPANESADGSMNNDAGMSFNAPDAAGGVDASNDDGAAPMPDASQLDAPSDVADAAEDACPDAETDAETDAPATD
jgi:hypothetical protein